MNNQSAGIPSSTIYDTGLSEALVSRHFNYILSSPCLKPWYKKLKNEILTMTMLAIHVLSCSHNVIFGLIEIHQFGEESPQSTKNFFVHDGKVLERIRIYSARKDFHKIAKRGWEILTNDKVGTVK